MAAACGSAENGNTENESVKEEVALKTETSSKGEWTKLFNGQNLDGWTTYNKETVGPAWKVEDGVLYLDASNKENWQVNGGGDIVTEKAYDNFHLKLDWKISENGNSGIIFLVQELDKYKHSWNTGPEYQLLDNDGHPDGKIEKHRTGDLYDLIKATEEAENPVGEWNTSEIIIDQGKLTFILNGVKTVETTLWDDSWKELIANSKFKNTEGFGQYQKGKIALQDHGNNIWFKNIMIKEL
ncbi:glycosyl hydrolase [Echinicola rosea]|uniref:Glycosyl hydrolase n=2 Tax=Echinicola rosea TaxID=1807691 RepID=A0ABQ1VB11_9BACT|nr:glycosyl hydrolase [Echinicola rosea]